MIPYGRQFTAEEEMAALTEVMSSGWLTQGKRVPEFEQQLASYCAAKHVVAVSSGTAALHVACLALGLGEGDRLWTTPISFVASANCGIYCGADVDFVDIDPHTRNLSVNALEQKLRKAKREKKLPKILVVVHFAGVVCDMKVLAVLADEYGFHIIEDAAHAIGSRFDESSVGDCRYSDATVFSFHPVKTLTTGEGGAVSCNSDTLMNKLRLLREHGVSKNPENYVSDAHGPWYYEQNSLGFNYRMTDLHAAIGSEQLKRLPSFIKKREQLVERYRSLLADTKVKLVPAQADNTIAWHLFVIELPSDINRRAVYDHMIARQVGVNVHYIPIHLQPFYRQRGFRPGDFPVAENYYKNALTLPLFTELTFEQQDYIVASLREVLQ
ncbi:UDP-4-amino-4,6-dideoxy-N-acetyl-beta-L-altrosamine transaminase [Teredinibacter waterburyi]|uniref:UDP-4-amino-4, 6-dideoxy-N-acetyl-beta-L-altrosamine transaminase n=1 Tax=Teredinibacter waterburyi TaxID=1500538 RepID=UPI00165F2C93|nr:UDP-4-amino-4,6-dideoxy-N-acetyl-beta-L-altrosamine transaminase [Teredinibacter waterburyi]